MSKWIIDPDHSVGAFSIGHLMVDYVHGQLNKVSGAVHFDPADITCFAVEFDIDVSSITTGVQKRDEHLKSQDFFDIGKYSVISFKSSNTERTGFSKCRVSGSLTIHGITKPIAMDVTISGPVTTPFGETCIGISGKTALNREDFGLTWNQPVENHVKMVGKYVEISMNIEADLADK